MRPGTKNAAEKRKKEILRQKRQAEKLERRQQRHQDRETRLSLGSDEDPDLAGIVPGPQPIEQLPPEQPPTEQPPTEPTK